MVDMTTQTTVSLLFLLNRKNKHLFFEFLKRRNDFDCIVIEQNNSITIRTVDETKRMW